jgi:hypothetical protein
VVGGVASPNTAGAAKTLVDWEDSGVPESFRDLGFAIADPIYYVYGIEGTGADGNCDHAAGEAIYSFQAVGDLDGDSTTSLFEISAGSSTQNELYRSPGVYRENELE